MNSYLEQILQNTKVLNEEDWEYIKTEKCLSLHILEKIATKDMDFAEELILKAIENNWIEKEIYIKLLEYGNDHLQEVLTLNLPEAEEKFPGITKEYLFPEKKSWIDLVSPDFIFHKPEPKANIIYLFPQEKDIRDRHSASETHIPSFYMKEDK